MKKNILIMLALFCASMAFGQKKVAVYVAGGEEDGLSGFVGAYMVDAIVKSSDFLAVERTSDFISELTKEQSYQQSGAVNDDQISRLGQQFGVQYVCVVKIGAMGVNQYLSARLIDVETGTVIRSSKPVLFTFPETEQACRSVSFELTLVRQQAVTEETPSSGFGTLSNTASNKSNNCSSSDYSLYGCDCCIKKYDAIRINLKNISGYNAEEKIANINKLCPDGYRSPTLAELMCIYANKSRRKEEIDFRRSFKNDLYFSSDIGGAERNTSFLGVDFGSRNAGKKISFVVVDLGNGKQITTTGDELFLRCIKCDTKQ
ncbi:MAG: hypothetical protein LBQ31_02535 [Bacteroidales bacterium]|jgi:hypothetical protein|nr:hypothetical protein [Bacteroidales bacterium]